MPGLSHTYRATCSWRGSTAVGYDAYKREHIVTVPPADGVLEMSSDVAFGGDPGRPNPEALLVAAASSCQLLSFLAAAARARLDVVAYEDDAEGAMVEDDPPVRITAIQLRPRISVRAPATEARVRHLCEVAHRQCYIANSLRSEIVVTPTVTIVESGA